MLLWTYDHPLNCLFISVSQLFYYNGPFIIVTECFHLQITQEDSKHHLFFDFIFYSDKKLLLLWFLLLNLFQICDNIFTTYHYLRFLKEPFFPHEFWSPNVYWFSPHPWFYYFILIDHQAERGFCMFFHNFIPHLIYLAQKLSFLVYFHCQTHRAEQGPLFPLCCSFCIILGMRKWGRAREVMSRVQRHSNNLRKCFFHRRVHTPGDAFPNPFLFPVQ